VCPPDDGSDARRPPNVHQAAQGSVDRALTTLLTGFKLSVAASTKRPRGGRGLRSRKRAEKRGRVFATVAGEVAVVAVDYRQAGAHEAGEGPGGEPCTQGDGRGRIAQ